MAPLHSGARRDPFVRRVQPRFEIVIGYDARRRVMADADDLHARQGHVALAGRLVLHLDDLPALVRAAVRAREVRPLRLMALRA